MFCFCLLLNTGFSGQKGLFDLFSHCRWLDAVGWVRKGRHRKNKLRLFIRLPSCKIRTSLCIIIFCCCFLYCFSGKFQAHPGEEGIMTGLLSGEEEVRAESQQSLLDHFSYISVPLNLRVKVITKSLK